MNVLFLLVKLGTDGDAHTYIHTLTSMKTYAHFTPMNISERLNPKNCPVREANTTVKEMVGVQRNGHELHRSFLTPHVLMHIHCIPLDLIKRK
jgi:hypothetical protein